MFISCLQKKISGFKVTYPYFSVLRPKQALEPPSGKTIYRKEKCLIYPDISFLQEGRRNMYTKAESDSLKNCDALLKFHLDELTGGGFYSGFNNTDRHTYPYFSVLRPKQALEPPSGKTIYRKEKCLIYPDISFL
jgi:hypothetical protein